MSKILSYVDNVVSLYNSDDSEAEYPNLSVTIKGNIESLVTQNGSINTLKLATNADGSGGYQLPSTMPSNGDFMVYNGSSFQFQNFDVEGLSMDNISDIRIGPGLAGSGGNGEAGDGYIAHYKGNELVLDNQSEYLIIDGKTNAVYSALKGTDRLLISIDSPGSGTGLWKLTLTELNKFISSAITDVMSIKNIDSNTAILADDTQLLFDVYNGSSLQQSVLDADGLKISGSELTFQSPTETTANAELNVISDGFRFSRYANTLHVQFEGTHNLILNNDSVQVGANLVVDGGSDLTVTGGSSVVFSSSSTIDQDLSKTSASDILFSTLHVTDTTNSTAVGTGAFQVAGGASVANDMYVGNNVVVNGGSVLTSSMSIKENINDFDNGLYYIMQLKPRSYNRLSSNKFEYGFIAEEVEEVTPSIVNNSYSVKGIEYTQIIPMLVSALQEQNNKITELENRINS